MDPLVEMNLKQPTLATDKKVNPFFIKKDVKPVEEEFSYRNKKILMIYGPPGTGKSTMAKVLARQCGY